MAMCSVHLHGALGREFGKSHRFAIETAAEAFRALNCAFPGRFVAALKEGHYKIIRGARQTGLALDLDMISSVKLGLADLHIVPVAAGASRKGGAIKAIAGTAIIGAAIFFSGGTLAAPLANMATTVPGLGGAVTWGNIATLGLGVALMGASTWMAKTSDGATSSEADNKSFALNGPTNTAAQGNAIPLIYGQVITGLQPISSGFDIENIGSGA